VKLDSPPQELLTRFPEVRLRDERASGHAREISELRSGGVPRYKRIPIEIMKINDVKAPSRLQLIIATIRAAAAADRSARCPSSDPLLRYCYNIIAISILH